MHNHDLFRWGFAGLLGLVGCWITVLNFSVVFLWYVRKEHHSFIPLLGGGLTFLAMVACPLPAVERFAWIPFIVDLGCLYSVLGFIYAVVVLRCFAKAKK